MEDISGSTCFQTNFETIGNYWKPLQNDRNHWKTLGKPFENPWAKLLQHLAAICSKPSFFGSPQSCAKGWTCALSWCKWLKKEQSFLNPQFSIVFHHVHSFSIFGGRVCIQCRRSAPKCFLLRVTGHAGHRFPQQVTTSNAVLRASKALSKRSISCLGGRRISSVATVLRIHLYRTVTCSFMRTKM